MSASDRISTGLLHEKTVQKKRELDAAQALGAALRYIEQLRVSAELHRASGQSILADQHESAFRTGLIADRRPIEIVMQLRSVADATPQLQNALGRSSDTVSRRL
jgi:hypothetical protein